MLQKLLLLGMVLLVSACSNNNNDDDANPVLNSMDVTLSVESMLGVPIEGVTVNVLQGVGGHSVAFSTVTTATDVNGRIVIQGVPEQSRLQFQLHKAGYANQVTVFNTPRADQIALTSATLIEREAAIVFSAAAPADLNGKDGAKLIVAENAFVDRAGNAVAGDVELRMTPVDISTAAGLEAFPGSFSGVMDDGSVAPIIVSLGTTEFEFTQGDEVLQLAAGQRATIELPMYSNRYPDGTGVQLGDEIPLWYLNEESGIWQQEGVGSVVENFASPSGFAMRAEVTHFSWWNADVAPETTEVTVRVTALDPNEYLTTEQFARAQAQLYGLMPGGRLGTQPVNVNETLTGVLVPADTQVCFDARLNADGGLEGANVFALSSDAVCVTVPAGGSAHVELEIVVDELSLQASVPSTATEGAELGACGQQPRLKPSNYVFPVSYEIIAGMLPRGVVINANGSLSGIPQRPWPGQNYSATIEVTDGIGRTAQTIVEIDVSAPLTLRSGSTTSILRVGHDQEVIGMFTADGGLEELSYQLATGGGVPPGMKFNDTDASYRGIPARLLINGQPSLEYGSEVKVQVKDQNCAKAEAEILQRVVFAPVLSGVPQNVAVGERFSFTASNSGSPIVGWNIMPHGVLSWASIDTSTGELSGTPSVNDVGLYEDVFITADGEWNAAGVHINDSLRVSFEVTLAAPVIANSPGHFRVAVNQPVSYIPLTSGGVVEQWQIENKPAWLSFDATTGAISGTPTVVGTDMDIIIHATNRSGSSETLPFNIEVIPLVVAPVLSGNAAAGTVGVGYLFTPNNSGGVASSASLTGTPPIGVTLNTSSAALVGTPMQAGVFNLIITASNAGGNHSLPVTLVINQGQQAALAFADPGPVQKSATVAPFVNAVSGGSGSGVVSYVSSDASVATVSSATGEVTVLASGSTVITATKAADADYLSTSASYSLVVSGGGSISGVPDYVYINTPYSFAPVVSGDTIISWSLANGETLPNGLTLNTSSGEVSGIATHTGQYNRVLRALNASGGFYELAITLEVYTNAAPVLWNPTNFNICRFFGEMGCSIELAAGSAFSHRFISDGGPVESWSGSGTLPGGMVFDSVTGVLSGTPTVSGDFFFEITASNGIGSDFLNLSITVKQNQSALTFSDAGPVDTFNTDLPFINTASGGESLSSIVYRSSDNSIASVNATNGEVTLLKPGEVTITATRGQDSDYFAVTASYQLRIAMAAPAAQFAAGSDQRITAVWSEVPDTARYNVYLSTTTPVILGGAGVQAFLNQSPPAILGGLQNDTPYYVAVEALSDTNIISELGAEVSATPMVGQILTGGEAFANEMRLAGDVLVVRRSLNDAFAADAPLDVYEKIAGNWSKTQQLAALQDWWGEALAVHQAGDGSYRIAAGSHVSSNFGNVDRQGGLATYIKLEKDICANNIDDNNDGNIDEASCAIVPAGTIYHNGIWQREVYQTGIYAEQLALGDDVMVVAKPSSNVCDANVYNCGQVDIHRISAGSWSTATQTFHAPRSDLNDYSFGYKIALNNSVLLASAPGNVYSNCAGDCAAYVYRDDGNAFVLEATLTPTRAEGKSFGHSVALSGDTIALGDPSVVLEGGAAGGDGALYLYQKANGALWTDSGESMLLTSPVERVLDSAQNFAHSVAIAGDLLVVGDTARNCLLDTSASNDANCGAFYLYQRQSSGDFSTLSSQAVMEQTTLPGSFFAHQLILDGKRLGVSSYDASRHHTNSGSVTVYQLP